MKRALVGVAATALIAGLILTATADAATGEQIGKNFGDLLQSIAKACYVGVCALVALLFILNRRYTDLAIFCVAAIIVGGFVLAPGAVNESVRGFWQSLTS